MLARYLGLTATDLAIDLGTANTLIGAPGEGVVLNEPSVLAVGRSNNRVLADGCAVGRLARQMQGRTPDHISVARPLAEGVITDFQLCETMLRYFMRKAQQHRLRRGPKVVVAVPGCITPVEKRAVFTSTLRAGARQVYLISEIKAAAIGLGLPLAEPVANLVCDIGGGTTEVGVLSLGEIVASRSVRVGGDAMDQAILAWLRRNYSLKLGPAAAERLRIDIGSAHPMDQERSDEVRGMDTVSGLPRRATVTSEEVRQALGEPLERIVEAIVETLEACPPDLAADVVDTGLVLAGGGALLRGLDRFLAERTGIPTRVSPEAVTAVAVGALRCLENFALWRDSLESSDEDV